MWSEDDIVLISAIEHYSYCPRQCALIHIESIFDENLFTLRGRQAHEQVDVDIGEADGATRVERGLSLWSEKLGLQGKADVVEFRTDGVIYPIEFKYGPRRRRQHDDLQLCAQAACLEEMFDVEVARGSIYSISSRRRREVFFTPELRAEMKRTVHIIRQMQREGRNPPPVNDTRCPNCSLVNACVPAVLEEARLAWHSRELFRVDMD